MVTCYLGIGSNLGNRQQNINSAVKKIKALKETRVIKLSPLANTKPAGPIKSQPDFLNAVLKIRTSLPPVTLLKKIKLFEKQLGRKKTIRYGPRIIDLDILFYGNSIIDTKTLKVPHPEISGRRFVKQPLRQVL